VIVSWFSAGCSSALATKLAIEKYGKIAVVYIHIDDQHEDTMRFVKDCEEWFGVGIEILQSELKNVDTACRKMAFVNSPYGAPCTKLLKQRVRHEWETQHGTEYEYVWGMDRTEAKRAERLRNLMVYAKHIFPLIDHNISKEEAHFRVEVTGIRRPKMYDMGYPNNNCIGCVKGGMGYWNKIRHDFPEVFKARCEMEKIIGGKVFKDFWLEDLPENRGRIKAIEIPDCGLFCEPKAEGEGETKP
jgi:hypothetical protein